MSSGKDRLRLGSRERIQGWAGRVEKRRASAGGYSESQSSVSSKLLNAKICSGSTAISPPLVVFICPGKDMDHCRYRRCLARRDYAARIPKLQSQIVSIVANGCTCSKSAARSPV
jgi:hypothetical protein